MQYRPIFANTPTVVRNLIVINIVMLLATYVLERAGIPVTTLLGMHYPASDNFRLHQIVTHMFMHGGFMHLLFNMYALWIFGRVLESIWGPRRFLIYYFVTGLGAVALHMFVVHLEISSIKNAITAFNNTPAPELLEQFVQKHVRRPSAQLESFVKTWYDNPGVSSYAIEAESIMQRILKMRMDIPTVGASGAVFGILLAFGMIFPNTQLMLLFPPIPIKAKYFVVGYGAIELYLGLTNSGGSIAHFAHLGGMLFGFILIKYWAKNSRSFY